MHDRQGLPLTTANEKARDAYNRAVASLLDYRITAMPTLKEALEYDRGFGMAHYLRGCMLTMFSSLSTRPPAKAALAAAQQALEGMTDRERQHVAALEAWLDDDPLRACVRWEAILARHPHDILALRFHHFVSFWTGRTRQLHAVPAAVLPAWKEDIPNYGNVLGMVAFGLEENGQYELAERHGRDAVARNPDDMWAIHSVAHVLEMQRRFEDGLAWLNHPTDHWEDRNPFRGHIWWHRGLFLIEARRWDEALALYDAAICDATSDFYLDVQNAASFLARLEFKDIDVGDRWEALADHAHTYIDDHVLAFTDIHKVLALVRAGRVTQAHAYLASMTDCASQGGTHASGVLRNVGIPIGESLIAFEEGNYAAVLETMTSVKTDLIQFGASNAQRDLIWLHAIEAARRSNDAAALDCLLRERGAARTPQPS